MSISEASPALVPPQARDTLSDVRAILRLATPITMIARVSMEISVTDAVMVANLSGAPALASEAVGSDFYSILYFFGAGTLSGLAPFNTAAIVREDAAKCA